MNFVTGPNILDLLSKSVIERDKPQPRCSPINLAPRSTRSWEPSSRLSLLAIGSAPGQDGGANISPCATGRRALVHSAASSVTRGKGVDFTGCRRSHPLQRAGVPRSGPLGSRLFLTCGQLCHIFQH